MERNYFRGSQRFHRESGHSLRDIDSIFSKASTSAARYTSNSNVENTKKLDESLADVVKFISTAENAARLSLKNLHVCEFLRYTGPILSSTTTSAPTRSRFNRLLFSIAMYNLPIRRFMACELEMCASIVQCLKISIHEQLGPQNMIDILRLLQVLSYEKTVTLALWTNDLISFLIAEIVVEPEQEWMPYCIAILCNLATRSKSVCNRIKKSTSYKKFHKRLTDFLQHDARIVVVSCLVLIGYLEEQIRNLVYCTQNVHDTFVCVFNVLVIGDDDCLMTRQIAADLLKRLIVSDTPSVSSVPTLASTGKDVLNYGFFVPNIQKTAELLVTLDPRMEEASKIYDLLLSFCSLQVLRSPVCQAIIRCQPTEARLTTPILAIAEHASLSTNEAINGEIPLKALKLLAYLLREIVEPNERVVPFVPLEQIVGLIENCVRSGIQTSSLEEVDFQCRRVQLGLRLAEVCARDEDIRNELLNVCSAHVCHEIVNFQFYQNPVVVFLTKPPLQRTEQLENWTMSGIGIVLELARMLAILKDHSKMHKDQYWQLLKDERIIPFLAYAVSYGDQEMVLHAFITYSHCAQVHAFPSHLLAEMVASCTIERRQTHERLVAEERKEMHMSQEFRHSNGDRPASAEHDERSLKALDELLKRVSIEGCNNLKDFKTSDLFAAYERKISMMAAKERELESLVRAKDEALVQSEKLRIQYRNGGGGGGVGSYVSELEISKMRQIVQECEDLKEKNQKLTEYLESSNKEHETKMAEARNEFLRSTQECERLKEEFAKSQKIVDSFVQNCDDLKKKLESSTATVFEQQRKITNLEQEKANFGTEITCIKIEADRQRQAHEAEISKMNADLAQKVTRIEVFINENNMIKRQFEEKILECEAVKEQVSQAESRCILKERELGRAHAMISNYEQKIGQKEVECQTILKEISQYEDRLRIKENECSTNLRLIDALKGELEVTKRDLNRLEQLRAAMLSLASSSEQS